jgi:hypothetical protein
MTLHPRRVLAFQGEAHRCTDVRLNLNNQAAWRGGICSKKHLWHTRCIRATCLAPRVRHKSGETVARLIDAMRVFAEEQGATAATKNGA